MNIWILTIGSSDVQLKTKTNWGRLFGSGRSQLQPDRGFSPLNYAIDGRFSISARVLGVIYSQPQAEQHFDDLIFPLIDNFLGKIKDQPINKIILVLGDQSIFTRSERSSQNHAYWQDTCTLQPLLEKYLKQKLEDKSPDLQFQPLLLKPKSATEGLDNWNAVLKLVQDEFSSLDFPGDATIYVSHQAGTPAISSAVQFTSLSRFGQQVNFLVSNERDAKLTRVLDSSEYLKGIRKKEAEVLLKSHNYSGMKALVKDYLGSNEEIKILLNASMQWNAAKFDKFLDELTNHPNFSLEVADRKKEENWWWIAYEEVYLALIRKKQDNIVEAFFHSFRAFEGIFALWGNRKFSQHIEVIKMVPYLHPSILDDSKNVFSSLTGDSKDAVNDIKSKLEQLKEKIQNNVNIIKDDRVEMNLRTLCNLFKAFRYADYRQNCQALKIFWDNEKEKNVSDKRNLIVHQVQGMAEEDLWIFWGVNSWEECQARLREFLNFIVKEDFPEGFATLEDASLMVKVHQELEKAIADL